MLFRSAPAAATNKISSDWPLFALSTSVDRSNSLPIVLFSSLGSEFDLSTLVDSANNGQSDEILFVAAAGASFIMVFSLSLCHHLMLFARFTKTETRGRGEEARVRLQH